MKTKKRILRSVFSLIEIIIIVTIIALLGALALPARAVDNPFANAGMAENLPTHLQIFRARKSCDSTGAGNGNVLSNSPSIFAPIGQVFSILPTSPPQSSKLFVTTGAFQGPQVDKETGNLTGVLQNYIGVDFSPATNFFLGGEMRNVFESIDYLGGEAGYKVNLGTSAIFVPRVSMGYNFLDGCPQAGIEPLRFFYETSTAAGAPTLEAGAGYYHDIPVGSGMEVQNLNRGMLGGHVGVVLSF